MSEKYPQLLPTAATSLVDWPFVVVRFRCHFCERGGDARTVACAVVHGSDATIGYLLEVFMNRCPWNPRNPARKPQKYGMKCGAYCPDIGRTSPPDWPPPMMGLTLIEGGKDDQLPAGPSQEPHRRRVGGD